MHLIFETESIANIKTNMSTLEEPLQEKLLVNGVIEGINENPLNGNKENILKEDNIISSTEEKCKIDDDKMIEEKISDLPESNITVETSVNDLTSTIDSVDLHFPVDTTTEEKENNQTIVDAKPLNSLDDAKKSADATTQENGFQVSEHSVTSEINESHIKFDTNDREIPIIKENEDCEQGEMELENDNIDEIAQSKKDIDNILIEKSACPNNKTTQQIEKETNTSELVEQNPIDTQTAVDTVEKDLCMQKIEENSRNVISIQNKVEESKNNEKNPFEDISKLQEVEDKAEVLSGKDMPSKVNEVVATEKCTPDNMNAEKQAIVDDKQINDPNTTLERVIVDCIQNIKKMVPLCISRNEIKISQIGDTEIAVKTNDISVVDINNAAHLNIRDVEIINDHAKTNIEDKKEIKRQSADIELSVNIEEFTEENKILKNEKDCGDFKENVDKDITDATSNDEVMFVEDSQDNQLEISQSENETGSQLPTEKEQEKPIEKKTSINRLSNTLDILSDDDDEPVKKEHPKQSNSDKQCIDIEDDDDIMVIEEDSSCKESKSDNEPNKTEPIADAKATVESEVHETDLETGEKKSSFMESIELSSNKIDKEPTPKNTESPVQTEAKDRAPEDSSKLATDKPLLSDFFLKTSKKKISDMTRDDLEEFCVLKIVESIVDRSNLSEIKTKLKCMAKSIDEYRKKAMMLTKQNRDLQVVLKSIQEEQKKVSDTAITPLKITRSVGMQVLMTDKSVRRKGLVPTQPAVANNTRQTRNQTNQNQRSPKITTITNIPVPRLVPANNAVKAPVPVNITLGKIPAALPNGIKNSPPTQKQAEKRARPQSVTVDLTDDEPPTKINNRSPVPPVRLVSSQNLLATQRPQFAQNVNSPRKVYIPISGPQNQSIRPGQTYMLKATSNTGRPRGPSTNVTRLPHNQVRASRGPVHRHPAPLPDAMKQYQPPNWKALPPSPDLKLSKVENGIVISWKIEGYQEDSYEEIASYQLYAYQETASPPSTALWKKIGDVKALPLPMACTLTQFMAGFKYYFAVRAVDVRSRLGPFSLPGSILLLNKM